MEKIKVGIVVMNTAELKMSVIGERIHDYTEYFKSQFYDIIQIALDHDNWVINFMQIDELTPKFYVDIYATNLHEYNLVKSYIEDNDKDPQLQVLPPYKTFDQFTSEKK